VLRVFAQASSTDDVGSAGLAAIGVGLVSNLVVPYSLYVLKTTGSGLDPGPGGLYGAIGGCQGAARTSSMTRVGVCVQQAA
jgi:hypothetical protein